MTLSIASLRHPSIQFCSTDNITGTLKKSTTALYALEEAAHQKSFDMNLRNEEEETDISHHLAGKPLDRVPSAVGRTLGAAIGRMIDTAVEKDLRLDMKIGWMIIIPIARKGHQLVKTTERILDQKFRAGKG